MATNKPRRLLTETELLSIVESSKEELTLAEEKLGELAGEILDGIYEPGTLKKLVESGAFGAATINVDQKPAFVMIYTRNALGWFTVEGVASLATTNLRHIFDAGDALAKKFNCGALQFVTRLSSLYKYALEHNYKPLGVILCKNALTT